MERLFDIFFSGLALLLLSPLLVPIALILKFSGEGDILFMQDRAAALLVGRHQAHGFIGIVLVVYLANVFA